MIRLIAVLLIISPSIHEWIFNETLRDINVNRTLAFALVLLICAELRDIKDKLK